MIVDSSLLGAIVEGTSDAVSVKDRDGRYVLCNPAAARLAGREASAVVGRTDAELFPADVAEAETAADRRILATGAPETVEEQLVVDGEPRRWLTTRSAWRAADGGINGVVRVAREVTAPARESERLLRQVLDELPVGVLVVDTAGDILFGNRAAAGIWGESIPRGEERWVRSRGWWHASGEPLLPHEWASVQALVHGVPHLDQLVDIEGFDGSRRTIRNSAVPIRLPSGGRGAVILNEDVTRRLALEARLAQAQKLEAVGQLAGGVAHDFNNLLMVVTSYAELLADALDVGDPRRDDVDEIRKAAHSAASLTGQLLSFGRRDAAQPRPVCLEAVVAGAERMLQHLLGANVRVVTRLADPANVVVIDPVQLEQIVLNLAVNARDAMPDGGDLTLSTRAVERTDEEARALGRTAGGRFVVLEVTDTGTGMDDHTRAHIFEPYFTTKERGRGTGLGLATVHAIVEHGGGTIRVSSAPGRGTRFEIELPVSPPAITDESGAA